MTALPKFDPWQITARGDGRAYRAYCAYSGPPISTLRTLSTGADAPTARSWSATLVALGWPDGDLQSILAAADEPSRAGRVQLRLATRRVLVFEDARGSIHRYRRGV